MNEDEVETLLDNKLTKRQLMVYLAMRAGYHDTYGIQSRLGYERHVVEECRQIVGGIYKYIQGSSKNYVEDPRQNVGSTPPEQLLEYISAGLGPLQGKDMNVPLKILKDAYLSSYEYLGRDAAAALAACKDCFYFHSDIVKGAGSPYKYYSAILKGYLRALPKKPRDRIAYEQTYGVLLRWNPANKQWEINNDDRDARRSQGSDSVARG